ncbi:MAG: enoyl-CoA hydratase/isomerase family protein [Spirochaetia bacterium]|nr:enoyl-CoA hydratase/isomerase family protein [Spirochaetia bacterium]
MKIEIKDHLARLTLARPPLNALNPDLIKELNQTIQDLERNPDCWALLIDSSSENFFSNGLDPQALLPMDKQGRMETFLSFLSFSRNLYAFSKPSLSAIAGHAMAGGAVIGALTDFRYLAEGKYSYCFSEVRVGLTIPDVLLDIIQTITGPHHLRQIAMLAERYKPEECLQIGLADRLVPADKLLAESEKYLRSMFELPLASIRSVKENLRLPIIQKFDAYLNSGDQKFAVFLEGNFVEGLSAVMERRRPKFKNP